MGSQFYRVVRVAYSPDNRWIVTADANHRIATWDAKLGAQGEIWHTGDYVQPIQFSPDSRRIYIATGTGGYPRQPNRVSIRDIETGEQLKEFGDSTIGLGGVSISPDERHALLWYSGGYVALWDIPEDRRRAFVTDYVIPRWGSISPDGRYLVSLGGSAITIWDVRSQSLLEVIFPAKYFFRGFSMAPRGQVFAVDEDPWIEIRDFRSGQIVSKIPNDGSTPFAFNSDGRRLARGEGTGVLIYNLRNPESPEELLLEVRRHTSARQIVFSADDRYLAVSDWNDHVHLWEKENEAYVFRYSWKIPAPQIDDIAFEPKRENPALIVIGDLDQLQLWELGETAPEPSIHFNAHAPIQFVRVGAVSSNFPSPRSRRPEGITCLSMRGENWKCGIGQPKGASQFPTFRDTLPPATMGQSS